MFLFVYGTLKEGYHNNHYLEDQELIGGFDTKPYYRLFDNGIFPMMIRDIQEGYAVSGEIWEIDEDIVDAIDRHEILYERKLIKVKNFKEPVYAYIYQGRVDQFQECYGQWP